MSRLLQRLLASYPLALLALVSLYTIIFTRLAWAQHAGMRTHRSDLGQIAQAVWNSSRGRFVEMTDNGYLATRLSDHVEPILALVSPVLWLWQDVRALLLLQVLAAAAGAFFVYALALRRFDTLLTARERSHIWQVEPLRALTQPLALAFAAAYLLAPQLQAATLTEFHAAPLAAPLILWAFWAVDTRRWVQFATAALLVALVKEEMALLAAGLGAWAMWRLVIGNWRLGEGRIKRVETTPSSSPLALLSPLLAAAAVVIFSLAWFYISTFVIVPAHAEPVYGVAESGYFARYGALGDSPVDILRSVATRPGLVWQIASEPARAAYLRDLLMAFGFLGLLAPEILLLALPVLLANLLSAYPAQYYGDFHYSAPLVPYFAVGALYGAARLWRFVGRRINRSSASFQHMPAASTGTMALVSLFHNSRTALRPLLAFALGAWLLIFAVALYGQDGRGPLGGRYDPTPVTAHHRLLPRFVDQIPADAAVTATAAVHPHVALRRFVYQFPLGLPEPNGDPRALGNAEWALLDVTTNTDMAPGDLFGRVQQMLASDWGVVDGADGLLLLRRGEANKEIPTAFYDFVRSSGEPLPGAPPLQATAVTLEDWPRWRQTKVTTTWQIGENFDADTMSPQMSIRTPGGDGVYSFAESTPPALIWYPPSRWQPGDTIYATTLWLWLPRTWGVVRSVGGGEPSLLAAYTRQNNALTEVALPSDVNLMLSVMGWLDDDPRGESGFFKDEKFVLVSNPFRRRSAWSPTNPLDIWISWSGIEWPRDVQAFVHLRRTRDGTTETIAQQDGWPRWFVDYEFREALAENGVAEDWRQLAVPKEILNEATPDDEWTVAVGLYNPTTGERVPLVDKGEELVLPIEVAELLVPDQACALIPASCASQ